MDLFLPENEFLHILYGKRKGSVKFSDIAKHDKERIQIHYNGPVAFKSDDVELDLLLITKETILRSL